jgi:O-antigen/teichoic acid export membrane protein
MNTLSSRKPTKIQSLTKALFTNRFVKDNLIMLVATGLVNLFSYVYQLAMGIMLTSEDYGTLLSLISLFVIIGVLTQTVTTVVAKTTASLTAENRLDLVGKFYRLSSKFNLLFGVILFVLLVIFSTLIAGFFKLKDPFLIIILFFSFVFAFPLASNWAILQGLQKFFALGSNQALFALLKVLAAVLLVGLGTGITGGIAALPVAYILSLFISMLGLKNLPSSSQEKVPFAGMGRYAVFTLITFAAITVLTNVDVVIAKHYLSAVDAGNYSAISVLGRIALYAPGGFAAVLFPKAAQAVSKGKDSKTYLLPAIGLTLLIVITICLIYWLLPNDIIHFLFANKYQSAEPYLFKYGVGMSLLALAGLGITYALSIGKTFISFITLAVMVVQLALLFTLHQTISEFVNVMLISGLLAAIVVFIYILASRKEPRPETNALGALPITGIGT